MIGFYSPIDISDVSLGYRPLYSLWDKIKDWGSSWRLECAKHYEKIFGDLFYDYGVGVPSWVVLCTSFNVF